MPDPATCVGTAIGSETLALGYGVSLSLSSLSEGRLEAIGSIVGLPEFLRLRSICFQYLACVAFLKPIQGK